MSDTSETDAKVQFLIVSLKEVSRLSQTFKEQRDEARHDFEEQSEVVQNLKVALEEVSKLARTLKEERDDARDVLEEVSLYLSSGIGDENTTAQQYQQRILDGIKHLAGHAWEERCKFERERDDLLKQRDECAAMCGRYKQERDIAEEDATNYHARIIELIAERDKTKQEPDEARDQADKYLAILKKHNLDQHGN